MSVNDFANTRDDIEAKELGQGGFGLLNFIATCIGCGIDDLVFFVSKNPANYWARLDRDLQLGVCSQCRHLLEDWDKVPAHPPFPLNKVLP